jgi:hypothetical protein
MAAPHDAGASPHPPCRNTTPPNLCQVLDGAPPLALTLAAHGSDDFSLFLKDSGGAYEFVPVLIDLSQENAGTAVSLKSYWTQILPRCPRGTMQTF